MKWISATDLEQWADRRDAEDKLPELICRLIAASVDKIDRIRFPSGNSIGRPGWDGTLICPDGALPFVPKGHSVWEVSTEKDVAGKAWRDFEKRSSSDEQPLPAGFERLNTTYVAVSLRRWPEPKKKKENSRDGFIKSTLSRGIWADVKVLDAEDLELWLEQCPAVAAWLARSGSVGRIPDTVVSLDELWHFWSHCSRPSVNEGLLIIERENELNSLLDGLIATAKCINIKADSPDEAQAFLIAAVQSLSSEDPRRLDILSRAIVVKDEQTAIRLPSGENRRLIVIARDKAKKNAGGLVARGHTVVVPLGNSDRGKPPEIVLRRQSRASFAKGLEALGVKPEHAELQARQCGCSVTVFQRRNPSSIIEPPSWASHDRIRLLVPAVLAGAWSEKNEADKSILERLAEQSYDRFSEVLHQFLSEDDPPLVCIADVWSLSAPADAFSLSDQAITLQDLTRLQTCVREVFSEIDPSLDLDPIDRPLAGLKGKVLHHSSWLRDGLAQTLLLIAVLGDRLRLPEGVDQQTFVNDLIRQLPGLKSNAHLLASLSKQLPVLFEAAPTPFVEALEILLRGNGNIASIFFRDKDAGLLGSGSPHTELLWALEGLAWDPEWLSRVCLILAKLGEIDPGGTYSNRPINSLREIFLPWHPGTNAPLSRRMEVLDLILQRSPQAGWQLLTKLLPTFHDISSPTYEPIWREAGLSQRETVTRSILSVSYDEIITRTLNHVSDLPNRWKLLLEALSYFSPTHRAKVYNLLETLLQSSITESSRIILWDSLREIVNRHAAFKDADWAVSGDELSRLSEIVKRLEPADPCVRFKWLFDEYSPDLPIRRSDRDDFSKELAYLRHEAIKTIIQSRGVEGFWSFLKAVGYPGFVASSVLENVTELDKLLDMIEIAPSQGKNGIVFSRCLSSFAIERYGREWRERLLARVDSKQWNAETISTAILDWPDELDTFELVSSLGDEVEQLYWSRRYAWMKSREAGICTKVINKLISAGRGVDTLGLAEDCASNINSGLILGVLDAALQEINERKHGSMLGNIGYYIEQLLETLRKRDDIARSEVARREYAFLPLIIHFGERKDLVLHEILSTDPSFFVEVLCDVFKPASRKERDELDENRRVRAEFGYRLLESWQTLPGTSSTGALNIDYLRSWALKARDLALHKDRAVIADQEIGKLFAYAPIDPEDEAWPHRGVRELLEELSNDEIERGVSIEQFNKRGVVHKAMFEGGEQERQLAKQWQEWATTVAGKWPRTAALLRKISESWERHANQEDERAEQDRLRFR